jgi:hypothetical protein
MAVFGCTQYLLGTIKYDRRKAKEQLHYRPSSTTKTEPKKTKRNIKTGLKARRQRRGGNTDRAGLGVL